MKPGAHLQTAVELLDQIEQNTSKPADAIIADGFRQRRYAGSKDRAAIATVIYSVLRCRSQLDWWLDRLNVSKEGRSRVLAFVILTNHYTVPTIPSEMLEGQYSISALTDWETDWLSRLERQALNDSDQSSAVRSNVPEWFAACLEEQFADDWVMQADALMAEAPVDIRANKLKITRDDLKQKLSDEGIEVNVCALSPVGLRLERRRPLTGTQAFKQGLLEVQDEGSQLVALLADVKPGHKVVDFCAGAGGKTLAIAAEMANKGRIIACDTSEARLARAGDRLKRAGAFTVERRTLTSARDKWVKRRAGRFDGGFDRVVVDAPCTGSGTWRRNPDQKWRTTEDDLAVLTSLQSDILESSARLVAPGGRLIYATCSMLRQENEDRIAAFLEQRGDFFIHPYKDVWQEVFDVPPPNDGDFLRLTPANDDTDGFFTAVLGRKI